MGEYTGYVGYVKLRDPKIEGGVLGARRSAEILLTFDDALRSIVVQIEPTLGNVDFELPIKVREGSWEALIPTTVQAWMVAAVGAAATAAATTAATQLTKNSVGDKDYADLARAAARIFQGVIRIRKHVGKQDVGQGVRFKDNNEVVEIPNADGVYMTTSRQELEAYLRTPAKLLGEIVNFLGAESSFAVGSVAPDGTTTEETVTYVDRDIFGGEEDEEPDETDEILFSQLKHDQYVVLEGTMTSGNSLTNRVGFKYNEHVLSCYPAGAPITAFREAFFKPCEIRGRISRLTESGDTNAKRPKIIFDRLTPIEAQSDQTTLL
jgi:hypothetical protein